MATSQEHFALDWIKSELLETLNTARSALETHVEALEAGADESEAGAALHECVNALHQVHGTLVMLELKGVTLLADHLERVASALQAGTIAGEHSTSHQSLMQGILELPGHLEELHSGMPDTEAAFLPLVNELRVQLGEPAMVRDEGTVSLQGSAGPEALKRFDEIGGTEKTRKIRGAYQQVLLTLLKGGDLARAMEPLRKVAQSMARVCAGTPFQAQWQAFGEFVESLGAAQQSGGLDADAVKVLRRVDSEIREVAKAGAAALQRPVPINLVRQLLDGAAARGRQSPLMDELNAAAAEGTRPDAMSQSGRQALVSAATALREELGTVKDRLDLFVRGGCADVAELDGLLAPLKQIGSTLSLLGFESSKSIVLDQVDAIGAIVDSDRCEEGQILGVAGALVQVDENLAGLTHGGKGEKELITDEAQRQVVSQARSGLDQVKQCIVDYVSSQWDVRHLEEAPAQLDSIAGALRIVPLAQAATLIARCRGYVQQELMAGHAPTWDELDRLADVLSGIDYYLERLSSDNPGGADDVLELAQRSLESLGSAAAAGAALGETAGAESPAPEPAAATEFEIAEDARDAAEDARVAAEDARVPAEGIGEPPEDLPAGTPAPESDSGPLFGAAENVDATAVGDADGEPALELETEDDFDLSSALFDEIDESVGEPEAPPPAAIEEPPATAAAIPEPAPLVTEAPAETSAETPTATPEATSSAADYVSSSLADTFDSDEDIVEIFGEEVDEVLESVDAHLEDWAGALEDETPVGEIRRAFHTLKGSGRLVGANFLGEMAWSVENMLNRVIDATVPVNAEFVQVVREARALVPSLRDAYERRQLPDMAAIGAVMERADVLGSGGSLADVEALPPAAAQAAGPESATAGAVLETEAAPSAPQGEAAADTESDTQLFLEEAAGLVADLEAARGDDGVVLDDTVMRALHTLSGSAALAGLQTVAELAQPAYEVAQALRPAGAAEHRLTGDPAQFFQDVAVAMADALQALRSGQEPEEQFQLVAEADRLLVEGVAPVQDRTLMTLPALGSVMKAPELLDGWRDGAVDMALADEIHQALAEIERVARDESVEPVAALCGALYRAHLRFEFESLDEPQHGVFALGHDRLLEQFDALAAGQSASVTPELLAELDALTPAAAPQDDDAPVLEPEEAAGRTYRRWKTPRLPKPPPEARPNTCSRGVCTAPCAGTCFRGRIALHRVGAGGRRSRNHRGLLRGSGRVARGPRPGNQRLVRRTRQPAASGESAAGAAHPEGRCAPVRADPPG